MPPRQDPTATEHARDLRKRQTKAESLVWYVLRGRRLCGLKFRRQYPIDRYIADFACIDRSQIVEIEGGYHDGVFGHDQQRQRYLECQGWRLLRFSNEDVLADVEAVAIAVARHMGLEPQFGAQAKTPSPRPSPPQSRGRGGKN